jgi:hypothetical protein
LIFRDIIIPGGERRRRWTDAQKQTAAVRGRQGSPGCMGIGSGQPYP